MECDGYQTIAARDGIEGLELATRERPDLILLDLRLPKMGGMRVLRNLNARQVNVPVVVVTAWQSEELVVEALRLGVKDYVKKPFSANDLLGAVKRALTEARLRRERDTLTEQLLTSNQELEQRVRQLTALYEVGKGLASILDLDELLDVILQKAGRVLRVSVASILLLDEQSGELVFRSVMGKDAQALIGMRLAPGQGIGGWVAERGEPLLVHDVQSNPHHSPLFDEITGFVTESILCVPLMVKGHLIGVVEALNKPQPGFTEDDLALLRSLAASAAVAIENARLFASEKRRASEMKAMVEIAQVVTEAVTERPKALLERITRGACDVLGADCAMVYPFISAEPNAYDVDNVAAFGTLHPLELEQSKVTPHDPAHMIRKIKLLMCEDVARDHPAWQRHPPFEQEAIRAFVGILLKADEDELGILYAGFRAPHRFQEHELTSVRLIAHQAASAIAKSRLFQALNQDLVRANADLRRKVRELEELQKINNVISSTLEIDKVWDHILRGAMSITGAPCANIMLRDESGGVTSHMCYGERSYTREVDPQETLILPPIVQREGRAVPLYDLDELPPDGIHWVSLHQQLVPNARSILHTPIVGGDEQRPIGLLVISSPRQEELNPDDVHLLEALANQAAIAIQNARYLQAMRVFQERQVEAERIAAMADIAGNMVHRINNAVGAIRPLTQQIEMKLERGALEEDYLREKLHAIRENAVRTLEVARQIRRPFREIQLEAIDVNKSIAAASTELTAPVGIAVDIVYGENLPPVEATGQLDEVFRNLMKNALDAMTEQGGQLSIRSRKINDRMVIVTVRDTGPGIPPHIEEKIFHMGTTTKRGGMGYGLWWSRTFLRRLGGDIVLKSVEGEGCTFTVTLPVRLRNQVFSEKPGF
jgi:GAF domain-containing protein/CheY-like chemotaxis protein